MIAAKTSDPIPYVDQAKALFKKQQYQEALAVIELAKQNNAYNEHTSSIEGRILKAMGSGADAIALYHSKIDAGAINPAIYNDLTQLYFEHKDYKQALAVVGQAKQNNAQNEHTISIEGRILKAMGSGDDAIALYQSIIDAGSTDPFFYADLAQLYFEQEDYEQALSVLVQAKAVGAVNNYTKNMDNKIRRAMEQR